MSRPRTITRPVTPGLGAGWPLSLAVLFIMALIWRLAYLARLAETPFWASLSGDAAIYWHWSGLLLRAGPLGSEPFFLGPLYPYALAGLRLIVGDSIGAVLCVQSLWGAAAVVLLAAAARALTSTGVAIAVAVVLCFHDMAVFFDGLVLMESLQMVLETLLLWMVIRHREPDRRRAWYFAFGALIGLLAAGRGTHALLVVPALATLVPWRDPARRPLHSAAIVTLGILAVVAPITVRNAVVSGEWIPLTYNAGYNLYVGNNPSATGGWVPISGSDVPQASEAGKSLDGRAHLRSVLGRELGATESSRYWSGQARRFLLDHPWHAARLTLRKLAMMWSRHEYPQVENADVYRRVAGPLGLPGISGFAFLGPLALAGIGFAWSRGAAGRFVVGYVVTVTLATALFFVTDRYRYHLLPGILLLAACGLEGLRRSVASRSAGGAWRFGLAVLVGVVITRLPTPQLGAERREWGIAADIGSRWLEKGRADLALPLLRRAVQIEGQEAARRPTSTSTRAERAVLHYEYGLALMRSGHADDALPWLERAAGELPGDPRIAGTLADAKRRSGTHLSEAWAAARSGDLEGAASLFQRAIDDDPRLFEAWGGLVRTRIQLGGLDSADATLDLARRAGYPPAHYWAHRAVIAAARGHAQDAREALRKVPSEAIASDPVLRDVVDTARRLLGEGGGVAPSR